MIAEAALLLRPHAHACHILAELRTRFTSHTIRHMGTRHEIALVAGVDEHVAGEHARGLGNDVINEQSSDAIRSVRAIKLRLHAAIATVAPDLDARLLGDHLLKDQLRHMRFKRRAIPAGFELLRVRAVFVRVILHDALEEVIRQTADRLPITCIRGHESATHHAADVRIDVHQGNGVPTASCGDGSHDACGRASVDHYFAVNGLLS